MPGTPRVLFSSGQIVFTALLLGPLPPLYMLLSNLRTMGKLRALRTAGLAGYALLMIEIVLIYFVPSRSSIGSLMLAVNAGLATCAFMYQPDWSAIARSGSYVRASFWRVAGVSVVRTLELLVWMFGVFGLLDYSGFHFAA